MNNNTLARAAVLSSFLLFTGCASMGPITKIERTDFRTTMLFQHPCREERIANNPKRKEAYGDCPDIAKMVENFVRIKEYDMENNAQGSNIAHVRELGFTPYQDDKNFRLRPNVGILHGEEALRTAGIPISSPTNLDDPEKINRYSSHVAKFHAETYWEKDTLGVTDRICVNTRESIALGDERVFVILYHGDYVFKRVLKTSSINEEKKESALFLCVGGILGDAARSGAKFILP